MSVLLPSFDPTQATAGTIETFMGTDPGKIVAANHSGVTLIFTFADGQKKKLWANTARLFVLDIATPVIPWQQDSILSVQGGYNRVDLELYGYDEEISETYPVALTVPINTSPAQMYWSGSFQPHNGSLGTFANVGSLGNWPFSNNEIRAGLATAGTVYLIFNAGLICMLPAHRDGTTVEGMDVGISVQITDSGGAVVSSYPAIPFAMYCILQGVSGAANAPALYTTNSPTSLQLNVSPGAGPPYGVVLQAITGTQWGLLAGAIFFCVGTFSFGFSATPPPAFT